LANEATPEPLTPTTSVTPVVEPSTTETVTNPEIPTGTNTNRRLEDHQP